MPKTADEIARETGFSVTTVRLVINGQSEKYRISAATRKVIEDYIALHGYSLNHAARSLKLNRSDTLGFVVPDLSNAFFARLMASLETLCRKKGLLLLAVSSHADPVLENRAITNLLARGVDGLVVAPCQASILPQLVKSRTRTSIVMFDRDYGSGLFPTVISANRDGGLTMARNIFRELRGEVFPFLCGHPESPSIRDRISGYVEAGQEVGVNVRDWMTLDADDSIAAGRRIMQLLIARTGHAPRAFMCSSLLILEGALQQIKAQIGSIDPRILIGTFDDHTMLDLLPNPIFSIRQNEAALTAQIFDYLTRQRADERKATWAATVVAVDLVRRNLEFGTRLGVVHRG